METENPKVKEYLELITVYEKFVKYFSPALSDWPTDRRSLRDSTEELILEQAEHLYLAVFANNRSALNRADTGLAAIRFRLRYLSNNKYHFTKTIKYKDEKGEEKERKERHSAYFISLGFATKAEKILSETGGMVNSMKLKL